MSLHAVVKGRESGKRQWREVPHLISVSATGSSFYLPRECEVGTLVSLTVPLPVHMRWYDFDKESYRVWGLIQHCEPVTADADPSRFHVGVAFIGKNCPDSYRADSRQHYRIAGVDDDGMWRIEEMKIPFKKRSDVRFWRPIDLYLALVDTRDGSVGGERTFAENVSRGGATVFTTLNVDVGDRVKFISTKYDFSGLAVVCGRREGTDHRVRLHLQFIENMFPVATLMKSEFAVEQV